MMAFSRLKIQLIPVLLGSALVLLGGSLLFTSLGSEESGSESVLESLNGESQRGRGPAARRSGAKSGSSVAQATGTSGIERLGDDLLNLWGAFEGGLPGQPPASRPASLRLARNKLQHHKLYSRAVALSGDQDESGSEAGEERDEKAAQDAHEDTEGTGNDGQGEKAEGKGFFGDMEELAAPFPYLSVRLSLHGVKTELDHEAMDIVKEAIATTLDLQNLGNEELAAALGEQASKWVVLEQAETLDCAESHECDDQGRRRLLSVDNGKGSKLLQKFGRAVRDAQTLADAQKTVKTLEARLLRAEKLNGDPGQGSEIPNSDPEEQRSDQSEDAVAAWRSEAFPSEESGLPTDKHLEEKWSRWYDDEEVKFRAYTADVSGVKQAAQLLTHVVRNGKLSQNLRHNGLNVEVGLVKEPKGFSSDHRCEVNCDRECGMVPLPPCRPSLEVDGEFVGPSYWRKHFPKVVVHIDIEDDETKKEVEEGDSFIKYTTDGTEPSCQFGHYYFEPITLWNTSTVYAGVCRRKTEQFSPGLAEATFDVAHDPLQETYPILWRSADGHEIRVKAPMAAFYRAPAKFLIHWANHDVTDEYPYETVSVAEEDKDGPLSLLFKSKEKFPKEALYGRVTSNVVAGLHDFVSAVHQPTSNMFYVTLPDGSEVPVPGSRVRFLRSDRDGHGSAIVTLHNGDEVQVPAFDVRGDQANPFNVWSSYSKNPLPGVAVDRDLSHGVTPDQPKRGEDGEKVFASGAYPHDNGLYGEYKIVWRSFDGSRIRIMGATPDLFEHGPAHIAVINRKGIPHEYKYTKALEKDADQDASAGVELVSRKDEFPRDVVFGWAKQNVPVQFGSNSDLDHSAALERAGINVGAGPVSKDSFKAPNDAKSSLLKPFADAIDDESGAGIAAMAGQTRGKKQGAGLPGVNIDGEPWGEDLHPHNVTVGTPTDLEKELNAADESAERADKARDEAEDQAKKMEEEVDDLQKKVDELENEKSSGAEGEDQQHSDGGSEGDGQNQQPSGGGQEEDGHEPDEESETGPQTSEGIHTESDSSWFQKVALGGNPDASDSQSTWHAVETEERQDRAKAYAKKHPRRIPIGALHPKPASAYLTTPPAGQEAYNHDATGLSLGDKRYPVLSVSTDGAQIRVAGPNDGTFDVGPSRIMVETADGGKALFPYEAVSAIARTRGRSELVASGLLFSAPAGGKFPFNAAYATPVKDPAVYPIIWRSKSGDSIKVLAENDGTFKPGPGTMYIKDRQTEDMYEYSTMLAVGNSHSQGPEGLMFSAAKGTSFPKTGAFAGPGKDTYKCRQPRFQVSWRSPDGRKLKVQAPDDGTFNLGPSRFLLHKKDGGMLSFPYQSVQLAQEDKHGSAGLLFTGLSSNPFPSDAVSIEPDAFPEPYPIISRGVDGKSISVLAANDGTFAPGPSQVRIRLSDGLEYSFEYAFVAWNPKVEKGMGGLTFTAASGVRFPNDVAYLGPIHGLHHCDSHPAVPDKQWSAQPTSGSTCSPQISPVRVSAVEAQSNIAYQVGTLCENEPVYLGEHSITFREAPAVLSGQKFIRPEQTDVVADSSNFLYAQVKEPSYVFLLWDVRGTPANGGELPAWVQGGFKDTGMLCWTSDGPFAVYRSLMPITGPVYLGGCQASPSKGAKRNYVAVFVSATSSISSEHWEGSSEHVEIKTGTWIRSTHTSEMDLQVLMYKDSSTILVRYPSSTVPSGNGFFKVAAITDEEGISAEAGQLIEYSRITDIEPGYVGYPGLRISADYGSKFPTGIAEIQLMSFKVLSVRPGGSQMQIQAPVNDPMFEASGSMMRVLTGTGTQLELPYQSIASLPPGGHGGLLLTAPQGIVYPLAAAYVFPSGKAMEQTGSDFPKAGYKVRSSYPVLPEASNKHLLRVVAPSYVFQPGPASLKLFTSDDSKGDVVVRYDSCADVVKDTKGPAGMLFQSPVDQPFPSGIESVEPTSFAVLAIRSDGSQIQVAADLSAFFAGPGAVEITSEDGMKSQYAYQSVAELFDDEGLIFTAPSGFLFPHNAAFVSEISKSPSEWVSANQERASVNLTVGAKWLESHPTGALVVTDAKAASGAPVAVSLAVKGAKVYSDRQFTFSLIPRRLSGQPLISLPDGDKGNKEADSVTFYVNAPSYVYILRDVAGTPATNDGGMLPLWLSSAFTLQRSRAITTNPTMPVMAVFRSKVPMSGPITLGGNEAYPGRGATGNYAIVLRPAARNSGFSVQQPPRQTTGSAGSRDQQATVKPSKQPSFTKPGPGQINPEAMETMVARCGGSKQAQQCLLSISSCMAPYKMGDLASCFCFYGRSQESEGTPDMSGEKGWQSENFCSNECRLAVYNTYEGEVVKATGFRMGCGLSN